MKDRLHMSEEL